MPRLFEIAPWLLLPLPFMLGNSFQLQAHVHAANVHNRPVIYAPAPTPRLMGGESVELNAQLRQPPPPPRDWLRSDDGTLDTAVGVYGDCSGMSELTHAEAAIDTCLGGRIYFIGHNPGVFTPLRQLGVGSLITYYDSTGVPHIWRISATRSWSRWSGSPPLASSDVVAQFQTCITLDGNWDEILDAVPV